MQNSSLISTAFCAKYGIMFQSFEYKNIVIKVIVEKDDKMIFYSALKKNLEYILKLKIHLHTCLQIIYILYNSGSHSSFCRWLSLCFFMYCIKATHKLVSEIHRSFKHGSKYIIITLMTSLMAMYH